MRILVASSSEVGIPILNHLLNNYDVIGVITSPDKPKGRGRELRANNFAMHSNSIGVDTFKPSNNQELNDLLVKKGPDLVVTVAYGRLIKVSELAIPKYGWLNIHFSLLPRWRGAAPVQYAIMNGDETTGVTIFKLDEGMDTGPIYSQSSYVMKGDETTQLLLERLTNQALQSLDNALWKISKGEEPCSQTDSGSSLAPKITKQDGKLDWSNDAQKILRVIRAFIPWPGAWTEFAGSKIQILSAEVAETSAHLEPGEIVLTERVLVGTGDGILELIEIKPEGKRLMSAREWALGIHKKSNLRFG